ncbi:hypothetical protein C5167_000852 [Papaver somniferum]|uniref:Uncharacterized protein n=1 Tax=Papaver somniferum TaxID=3469 RepID=A0A4Y7KTK7_PAPSO|nr:hypothetical protein C5167_000852 [Papaver somniferum]
MELGTVRVYDARIMVGDTAEPTAKLHRPGEWGYRQGAQGKRPFGNVKTLLASDRSIEVFVAIEDNEVFKRQEHRSLSSN